MQHVHGHGGNLGNECADHAAALGSFGLISSHNIATRWVHQSFDAAMCFNDCNNIGDVLKRLQHIRTIAVSLPHDRGSVGFSHRVHRVLAQFTCLILVCFSRSHVFSTKILFP